MAIDDLGMICPAYRRHLAAPFPFYLTCDFNPGSIRPTVWPKNLRVHTPVPDLVSRLQCPEPRRWSSLPSKSFSTSVYGPTSQRRLCALHFPLRVPVFPIHIASRHIGTQAHSASISRNPLFPVVLSIRYRPVDCFPPRAKRRLISPDDVRRVTPMDNENRWIVVFVTVAGRDRRELFVEQRRSTGRRNKWPPPPPSQIITERNTFYRLINPLALRSA